MNDLTPRQNEIIGAAIHLISRKGIQELTIRNLARELHISEPAIYRHFESKSEILSAMLEYLHHDTRTIFEQSQKEGNAIARVRQYFTLLFSRLETNPASAAVVFSDEAFMNEERLSSMVRALVELALDNTTELLIQAREEGEPKQGTAATTGRQASHPQHEQELATLLVGGVRLMVRRWHMDDYSWSLSERGIAVVDTFLGLIEARS